MRTAVAETSIAAYYSMSPAVDLQPKERRIMELFEAALARGKPIKLTRQQISQIVGMPINGVCGRINSLLTKKALIEDGERIDPVTHKAQKLLALPVLEQGELFQ